MLEADGMAEVRGVACFASLCLAATCCTTSVVAGQLPDAALLLCAVLRRVVPTMGTPRPPPAQPLQVSIARCDSHELFRSVQDTRGVVVLLRRGGSFLPQPHQLSTSLRSQSDGSEGDGSSSPLLD